MYVLSEEAHFFCKTQKNKTRVSRYFFTNFSFCNMTSHVVLGTDASWVSRIVCDTKPKANERGGKVINIKCNGKKLTMQTPAMTTWGVAEAKDTDGNPTGKFSVSLQFGSDEYPNEEADKFLATMRAFEQKVHDEAYRCRADWFTKEKIKSSADVIDNMFYPMLHYPKIEGSEERDMDKAPTIKAKLNFWKKSNQWPTEVYDEEGNPLFMSSKKDHKSDEEIQAELDQLTTLIAKYSTVQCLYEFNGVWITGNKTAAICWDLKQIVVHEQEAPAIVSGVCALVSRPPLALEEGSGTTATLVRGQAAKRTRTEMGCAEFVDSDDEQDKQQDTFASQRQRAVQETDFVNASLVVDSESDSGAEGPEDDNDTGTLRVPIAPVLQDLSSTAAATTTTAPVSASVATDAPTSAATGSVVEPPKKKRIIAAAGTKKVVPGATTTVPTTESA